MNRIILLFSVLISFTVFGIDARQGCCSHHGGVCDCACCDGTPLSAKCAPYYDCSENNTPATSNSSELQGDSGETVYFNTNTLKYHCPSCQWAIKCTQNCVSVSLEKAKESGGIPCKVCGGRCR